MTISEPLSLACLKSESQWTLWKFTFLAALAATRSYLLQIWPIQREQNSAQGHQFLGMLFAPWWNGIDGGIDATLISASPASYCEVCCCLGPRSHPERKARWEKKLKNEHQHAKKEKDGSTGLRNLHNLLPPDTPFLEEKSHPYLTNLLLPGILLVAAEHMLNCYCTSGNSFHILHKWGSAGWVKTRLLAFSSYSSKCRLRRFLTIQHCAGNLISLTLNCRPLSL